MALVFAGQIKLVEHSIGGIPGHQPDRVPIFPFHKIFHGDTPGGYCQGIVVLVIRPPSFHCLMDFVFQKSYVDSVVSVEFKGAALKGFYHVLF
jgi:hypothetical protein